VKTKHQTGENGENGITARKLALDLLGALEFPPGILPQSWSPPSPWICGDAAIVYNPRLTVSYPSYGRSAANVFLRTRPTDLG